MRQHLTLIIAVAALLWVDAAQAQIVNAPTTNGSVVITTGNTFQTVVAALGVPPAERRSLTIQNNNANSSCQTANTCDLCWVYVGSGTATEAKSIELSATQAYTRYYPYVPSDAIQATCASSSDTLYVDTQ